MTSSISDEESHRLLKEQHFEDFACDHAVVKKPSSKWSLSWTNIGHAFFFWLNITAIVLLFVYRKQSTTRALIPPPPPQDYARVDDLPTIYKPFYWWTEYSQKDPALQDQVWDDINTGHGFIAVDTEWARDQGWHSTMYLPSDNSKGVYLLEAYHMLHCLKVTRLILMQSVRGEELSYNPAHSVHCLDALRQFVVCKADNTPLYTFGRNTAGDEQLRKCNDWGALREYATKNTACYADDPRDADRSGLDVALGDHFGHCDGGYDGVLENAERKGNWPSHQDSGHS